MKLLFQPTGESVVKSRGVAPNCAKLRWFCMFKKREYCRAATAFVRLSYESHLSHIVQYRVQIAHKLCEITNIITLPTVDFRYLLYLLTSGVK